MDTLDDWFPYREYRPHQREMLNIVASVARDGGIAMIDAPTGSGKSSVVRLVAGEDIPHNGTVRLTSGLVISYVPQDTSFLRGDLMEFAKYEGVDASLFLTILRKLDFPRVQFEKDMRSFSAGQRKKVLLAKKLVRARAPLCLG